MKLTLKFDVTRLIDVGTSTNEMFSITYVRIEDVPFVPVYGTRLKIDWSVYIGLNHNAVLFFEENHRSVIVGEVIRTHYKREEVVVEIFLLPDLKKTLNI